MARTTTFDYEIEVVVSCSECGADLNVDANFDRRGGGLMVKVPPCERCMDEARDKAHDEGYTEGVQDGETK